MPPKKKIQSEGTVSSNPSKTFHPTRCSTHDGSGQLGALSPRWNAGKIKRTPRTHVGRPNGGLRGLLRKCVPQGWAKLPTPVVTRLGATTTKAGIASEFPFDILFQIFEEYAKYETIACPLETILLVCCSWHQAALLHPRLWSSFAIACGDFWYWVSRIPRRLSRCPPDCLMDIELDMAGDMIRNGRRSQRNEVDFKLYHEDILSLLTGKKGELVFRWRSLDVTEPGDSFHGFEASRLARFLVYPTPNLQEIDLEGFFSSFPVLPSTPSLRIFSAFNTFIPSIPDLSSAVKVYISTDYDADEAVSKASNLVSLHLSSSFRPITYGLSTAYPHLTSLRLPHGLKTEGLDGFSAPALKGLIVDFWQASEYLYVLSCKGIPLHQLEEVSIEQQGRIQDVGVAEYCHALRLFLRAIKNVKVLQLHESVSRALVFKLLTSDCESLYQGHTVLLQAGGYEIELGRGEDRSRTVNELRECVKGAADGTWGQTSTKLAIWVE